MPVVIVESPAKAKTINRYLGRDYEVMASFGHVRDLSPKDGSVDTEDFTFKWEVSGQSKKHLQAITQAVKTSDGLILATDPDREGEAISWHILDELQRKKILKDQPVKRVSFNEITQKAIKAAFQSPRDLDHDLVDAYLARRALDYLVGFTLSPVLWRKLPGSRSAGRVQSVALRLVCDREAEIEVFRPQEYWSVTADLKTQKNEPFQARLTHFKGKKLGKHDLNEQMAREAVQEIEASRILETVHIDAKKTKQSPPPPFITSTLQQEAARKLGMAASHTMRIAQQLYEGVNIHGETVGLITYMRTDGVTLSQDAIYDLRKMIESQFSKDFLPDSPRQYKSKAKNAQEAHEAIRPTRADLHPKNVAGFLNSDQRRLYELIWKRAMASQMREALLDKVAVDFKAGEHMLRANGSVIAFPGFMALYQESRDEEEEGSKRLPPLEVGDKPNLEKIEPEQHFTQPPPRYSEASLVKKLEELGIGRPSTYASILKVLQDRGYVNLDKRRFIPADRGRVVTAFLVHFFPRYVAYDFTADMEERLDDISAGNREWKNVLSDFWQGFSSTVDETKNLTITNVIDALDENLSAHFFPPREDGSNPRKCPQCEDGRLGLKLGRSGGFIGCSNYPTCKHTRSLSVDDGGEGGDTPEQQALGEHEGRTISLKQGPYGWYVEQSILEDEKKPKRSGLPKNLSPDLITLDLAIGLLSLPRLLGVHEDEEVTAGLGRFGPYVKKGKTFKSIPKEDDVLTIGLNRAVALLAEAKSTQGTELGKHPKDGKAIALKSGRYGPYVQWGKVNASLPKGQESITLDDAVQLLDAKVAKTKAKK